MNTTVIRALAKINLAIDVIGKREDGYHEIDLLTIPLKLHDSIEITPMLDGSQLDTYLYCDDPTIVCDESNLAYKALYAMRYNELIKGTYRMSIHKRIPVQAGLGGGSADAAAVMRALLSYIKDKEVSPEKINEIAKSIGSDVPFCFVNKPARVRGMGEKLEEIKVKASYHVLIVKPGIGLSTKSVYDAYDEITEEIRHPDIDELIEGLAIDDHEKIRRNLVNVLSVPAIKALPLIQELLDDMETMGLDLCGMSGTGSACFALSKDKKVLELASNIFEKKGNQCFLTEFAL